jgi:hypothetical protein
VGTPRVVKPQLFPSLPKCVNIKRIRGSLFSLELNSWVSKASGSQRAVGCECVLEMRTRDGVILPRLHQVFPAYDRRTLENSVEALIAVQLHNDSLPGVRSVIDAIDLGFGCRSCKEKKNRSTASAVTTLEM